MKPSDLKTLVSSRIKAKIKRPILVESSPGLGKTQIAAQIAEELGIDFKAIHAPLLQPEDYGFPVISTDKKNVNFVVCLSKFPMEGSDCGDKGVLLIDEMSQADTSAQKILANLIQEREIHGIKLKKGWSIIATGNRVKDRSGANRILGHLGNRLTRVEMEVSLEDWTKWALENDVKPEVISFIRFRPNLLSNYDPQSDINATPRAWVEGVSTALGNIPPELELDSFSGDVGEGPAAEFMAYLKVYRDLPDIDAIIKDPLKAEVPRELSICFATIGALVSRVTAKNFPAIFKYVRRLPKEFHVLFIRDAHTKEKAITVTKDFIDWTTKEGKELFL